MPIPLIRQHARDDLLLRPPPRHDLLERPLRQAAPAVVKLHIVPANRTPPQHLEGLVVEAAQVLASAHGAGDGGEGDEECGAEIVLQAIDEADDAAEGHGLLDVEVQAVEGPFPHHVPQRGVVALELRVVVGVEAGEGAGGGAAEHAKDAHADSLEGGEFGAEGSVFGVPGGVIVEGYVAGRGVEVDGGEDEVGDGDEGGGLGEEGEEGNGVAGAGVMGLVVKDHAGGVG